MFKQVNLKKELIKARNKSKLEFQSLEYFNAILDEIDVQRNLTLGALKNGKSSHNNNFNIDIVDRNAIFHISQIKKICIDYRLRFLDTAHFKGEYPEEAITKVHNLERAHQTTLGGFKIIAPLDVFKLRKADDPLLFAPMGNGYYYLIHKWGTDLHPFRKLKYWSFKNVENLGLSLALISILFTSITYPIFTNKEPNFGYLLMIFLFYFKGVVGMFFIFFGGSGKNFSEYSWQSEYDKIH